MFEPPRCPNPHCTHFKDPKPGFLIRKGSYQPKCRAHPVPRFKCRACGLSRRCLELKARKISRNAARLDRNLQRRAAGRSLVDPSTPAAIQFDELETYEGGRRTRPLTLALAIDARTRFHYGTVAAPIRPRGKMTDVRKAAIAASEARHGPRRDRSRAACQSVLRRAAALQPAGRTVELFTDEKSTYPSLAAEAFRALAAGARTSSALALDTQTTGTPTTGNPGFGTLALEPRRLVHVRIKSIEPRTTGNPLFPINSEEADMRDKLSRLRRESWLVSKMCKYLNLHLALYSAWRNWARPRFNRDHATPGQLMGLADRPLRTTELVGWRQDWGGLSPCPFGRGSLPVRA